MGLTKYIQILIEFYFLNFIIEVALLRIKIHNIIEVAFLYTII